MTKKQHNELDNLWKEVVRLRANNTCQRFGCPNCHNEKGIKYLTPHHIIPRTKFSTKYNPRNGVLLCRGSHMSWAHSDDPIVQKWVHKFYAKFADMQYLKRQRTKSGKLNFYKIKEQLENERKRKDNGISNATKGSIS
jgi:hypothetical protein